MTDQEIKDFRRKLDTAVIPRLRRIDRMLPVIDRKLSVIERKLSNK